MRWCIIYLFLYLHGSSFGSPMVYKDDSVYRKRYIPQVYQDIQESDTFSDIGVHNMDGNEAMLNGGCGSCRPPNMGGSAKQKATNIAQKAAQEAKAASEAQNPAGQAASQQIKKQLAEKALGAAKAAEAALAGKHQIVQQLESLLCEAKKVVQEQQIALQNAEQNVQTATQGVQLAQEQMNIINKALKIVQQSVTNADQLLSGAQQDLTEKTQIMEATKVRMEQLNTQLNSARLDLANTKKAAYKAACAAQEAKVNASRSRRMLAKQIVARTRP